MVVGLRTLLPPLPLVLMLAPLLMLLLLVLVSLVLVLVVISPLLLPAPLLLQVPLMPLLLRDVLHELSLCPSPWQAAPAAGVQWLLRSYLISHELHELPGSHCQFRH